MDTTKIIELKRNNLSLRQIAKEAGCSYEWTRTVLKQNGIYTGYPPKKIHYCKLCGAQLLSPKNSPYYLQYCLECYHHLHWIVVLCAECGKSKEIRMSYYKAGIRRAPLGRKGEKKWFCNRQCFGRYVGKLNRRPIVAL